MLWDCPFCHHQDNKLHRMEGGSGIRIMLCLECGLFYPSPRMGESESSDYLNTLGSDSSQPRHIYQEGRFSAKDPVVRLLMSCGCSGGNALDIGAYDGSYVRKLESLGFSAWGIEPQESAVKISGENNSRVLRGIFPGAIPEEIMRQKYNLITALESIYYFVDLKKGLLKINEMLNPGGILLIRCHQGNSRYYSTNLYFSRYGEYVQAIPTLKGLRHALGGVGFKIIKSIGITPAELLPRVFRLNRLLVKVYNKLALEYTGWDLNRADRLVILAEKAR